MPWPTREQIQEILGCDVALWYPEPSELRIELLDGDYVTFEELSRLSEACGTNNIALGVSAGFGGTDTTPADDPIVWLTVQRG